MNIFEEYFGHSISIINIFAFGIIFIICVEYIFKYPETFYVHLDQPIQQHKNIQRIFGTVFESVLIFKQWQKIK